MPVTHSLGCCLDGTIRLLFSILYFIVILLKSFFFYSYIYKCVQYKNHSHTYTQQHNTFSYTFLFFCHSIFQQFFCSSAIRFTVCLIIIMCFVLFLLCFVIYLFIYFMFINVMPDCVVLNYTREICIYSFVFSFFFLIIYVTSVKIVVVFVVNEMHK